MAMPRLLAFSRLFAFSALCSAAPHQASMRAGNLVTSVGGGSRSDANWIDLMTAPETARAVPALRRLASIWERTGLNFKLEQSRHLTLLMPTDSALIDFERALPCLDYEKADQILQSLLLPEVFKASEMANGDYPATTATGVDLILRVERPAADVALLRATAKTPAKASGQLPLAGADSAESAETAVHPTLKIVYKEKILAQADGHFLDTANGVGYTLDNLPVLPESLGPALLEALQRCNETPVPLQPPRLPWHIERTNLQHAAWGSYDGAHPQPFFETDDSQPDNLGLQQVHRPTRSRSNASSQTAPLPVIGVIQPRQKTPVFGVLG